MQKTLKLGTATLAGLFTFIMFTAPALAYGVEYGATPYDAAAFSGVTLLIVCCSAIIGFGINAVLAYVVYRDAQKNNVENPILWAAITFFFTLVGLLIYFLAIRPGAMTPVVVQTSPVEAKEEKKAEK